MKIDVGDVRLFVDVNGAEYVPEGPAMVRRPTRGGGMANQGGARGSASA